MKTIAAILASLLCLAGALTQAASPQEAVAATGRLEADIQRDARSKPLVILELLDLQNGDKVADIFGGGGYYSELMATVVGPEGEVLLHNNRAYRSFVGEALTTRFADRDPGRITLHDREVDDLGLGSDTLDAAVIIMSYHDLYHTAKDWPAIDSADFLGQIFKGLKSGGRFLIVDHVAQSGSGSSAAQDLHRIDPEFAKKDITSIGFRFVAGSEELRNPQDDYSIMVFKPEVRGKTDRFVMLFEKP
jgi:predicted methyltransferase